MENAKNEIQRLADELPDDVSTVDEGLYHMYLVAEFKKAEDDIAAGRLIPNNKALKMIDKWANRNAGRQKRG